MDAERAVRRLAESISKTVDERVSGGPSYVDLIERDLEPVRELINAVEGHECRNSTVCSLTLALAKLDAEGEGR